jgi:hypothetical protein
MMWFRELENAVMSQKLEQNPKANKLQHMMWFRELENAVMSQGTRVEPQRVHEQSEQTNKVNK